LKKRIYLQFAMAIEGDPLVSALNAQPMKYSWAEPFPFRFFSAARGDLDLIIGFAGADPVHGVDSIGTMPAAVLSAFAVRELRPALVLNPGTCGGFESNEHKIGEVLIGTEYVAFHGRRIDIPAIPSMRDYGIGKYRVADSESLRRHCSLRNGIVSTGDAIDYSAEDRAYMLDNRGTLKEMEAAAIAWVCQLHSVPFLPIKAVTDFVDHSASSAEQFMKNYATTVQNLTKETLRILDYLNSHPEDSVWKII
jgi:5'-methylthioadenosine nucleosidase